MSMNFEQFKDVLRKLATELEDLWIEKELYRNLILTGCISTPEVLQKEVNRLLADPQIRQATRERFAGMWQALNETATAAWNEELLNNLPPTGKPN